MSSIAIEVVNADALEYEADLLVLKYAQRPMGLDSAVISRLSKQHTSFEQAQLPFEGTYLQLETQELLAVQEILFVGVQRVSGFRYEQIREFADRALTYLQVQGSHVEHLAITVHGVGYGLDETESLRFELHGLLDAIAANNYPKDLKKISIIERDTRRSRLLQDTLEDVLPGCVIPLEGAKVQQIANDDDIETEKPHIFVAMPFSEAMEDVFYYGIQSAAHEAGLLCERTDITPFTGEIIERIKDRIATSEFIIADLTDSNPNVYLEVGYAWGKGKRTILITTDLAHLQFDVQGHKCLQYSSIRELEKKLMLEIQSLVSSKK